LAEVGAELRDEIWQFEHCLLIGLVVRQVESSYIVVGSASIHSSMETSDAASSSLRIEERGNIGIGELELNTDMLADY
jgi:hypothetical protein